MVLCICHKPEKKHFLNKIYCIFYFSNVVISVFQDEKNTLIQETDKFSQGAIYEHTLSKKKKIGEYAVGTGFKIFVIGPRIWTKTVYHESSMNIFLKWPIFLSK